MARLRSRAGGAAVRGGRDMTSAPLVAELRPLLEARLRIDAGIVAVERSPNPYASSREPEDWLVRLDGRPPMSLMAKRIDRAGLFEAAARTRPVEVYSSQREIAAYEHLFEGSCLPVPQFVGVVDEPPRQWLVTVTVAGTPLTEIGEPERWSAAVVAAARFHDRLALRADDSRAAAPFDRHSSTSNARWYDR